MIVGDHPAPHPGQLSPACPRVFSPARLNAAGAGPPALRAGRARLSYVEREDPGAADQAPQPPAPSSAARPAAMPSASRRPATPAPPRPRRSNNPRSQPRHETQERIPDPLDNVPLTLVRHQDRGALRLD